MNRSVFKIVSGVMGAALLSLCSGCFFAAETLPAAVCSPGAPARRSELPVRLGVIRNISGAGREFLVREKDGRLAADPARLWLNLPEVMLERFVRERFNTTGNTLLNMVICRQEITAADNTLHYNILFEMISPGGDRKEYFCKNAVAIGNGSTAAAMEKVFNETLDKMEKYILEQKIK